MERTHKNNIEPIVCEEHEWGTSYKIFTSKKEDRINLDPVTLSYIAGLLDGEGTVSSRISHRKRGIYSIISVIEMCDKDIIYWLREITGIGYVRELKKKNIKHKTSYRWEVLKYKEVKNLLISLLPFLKVKHKQALLVLSFPNLCQGLDRDKTICMQHFLTTKMRSFNQKGKNGEGNNVRPNSWNMG